MTEPRREIGRGFRSVVQELGEGRVVKIPYSDTPARWLRDEWRHLVVAERSGAPCPQRPELVEVDEQPGLAYDLVDGEVMWDALVDRPRCASEFGSTLWELQSALFSSAASFALPAQRDRLRAKLEIAGRHLDSPVQPVIDWVFDQQGPIGFCHGDVHPKNVVVTSGGPVLVDWFDASRGILAAEVARTSMLLDAFRAAGPDGDALATVHRAYLASASEHVAAAGVDHERWVVVQRLARVAEGFDAQWLPSLSAALAEF